MVKDVRCKISYLLFHYYWYTLTIETVDLIQDIQNVKKPQYDFCNFG